MTVEGPAGALELLGRPFLVFAAAQTARGHPPVANQLKRKHKKNRLEAFSDGVFAIAITLLVLEIAVPHVRGTRLLGELAHEWPVYLAYFVSFMTIGAVWIEHSALVDALDHVDGVFMRLNLVLLLFVAFLPFPTRIMSEYAGDMAGQRVAVVFYGIVLLAMTLMLLILGRHAEREGLFGGDLADERKEEARVRYQLLPALVAYVAGGALGLLSPRLGVIIYLLIAVYLAIPIREVTRLYRRDG